MKSEEFLCRHIVLRKRPLQVLGSVLQNIVRQHKLVGSHLFHDDLVALWIRCVSHDLKSHVILSPQTPRTLGLDLATLDLADLITQKHRRNTIKLEALERMLATHVQKKINAQTTRGIPLAKIILARGQFKGLGNQMTGLLRRNATKLDFVFNPQHLAAIHQVPIIKPKCVLPADDVGVDFTELITERQNEFLFGGTAHELRIGFHTSQNEHLACRRLQKIPSGPRTYANLNNGIALVGHVPQRSKLFGLSVL